MTKNNKILIIAVSIVCIGIFIYLLSWNNSSTKMNNSSTKMNINKNWIQEFAKDDPDIILLNSILRTADKLEDYKKCDWIIKKDIQSSCISQIKLKFSDIWIANNKDDCKKITGDNTLGTQQKRQDVCYLNVSNNRSKSYEQSQELCNNIQDINLKWLCIAQWEMKFWKSKK
jgi:hypothetical protein